MCSVALLGAADGLKGDAAAMAQSWGRSIVPLTRAAIDGAQLVIDALFGAGIARPISGEAADVIAALNASDVPVLAVDVPSGLDGTTGQAHGPVIEAARTVTFFRRKPGHLLMPGRSLCGEVTRGRHRNSATACSPTSAQGHGPTPRICGAPTSPGRSSTGTSTTAAMPSSVSGPAAHTGAARMGARGALRVGAGLVTVASPPDALKVNAAHLTAIMLLAFDGTATASRAFSPTGARTRSCSARRWASASRRGGSCDVALASGAATVLDADAITSFADGADELVRRRSPATRAALSC